MPAPAAADMPKLYREVEALRLRNQLDPKRFYRKDEGESKGVKGLPKYFAVRKSPVHRSHTLNFSWRRLAPLSQSPHPSALQALTTSRSRIASGRLWMSWWTMQKLRAMRKRSSRSCRPSGEPEGVVRLRENKPHESPNGDGCSRPVIVCPHHCYTP